MKKYTACMAVLSLLLLNVNVYGATAETKNTFLPNIFHNIGGNFLDSFTYNYGLNFIGAVGGTLIIIQTGFDWKWRNIMFDNRGTENIGNVAMTLGNAVPVITPVILYISGKYLDDEKAVTAAEALTQTFILTAGIQTPIKMITGHREPGLQDRSSIFDDNLHERIYGEDDFSNEWDWFNMDFVKGWPSGHTANAFSAAATLSEIYHDNFWVKAGAYTYAVLLGIGTTTTSHWFSEAFSGALIGYAIGKTVGKSYRKLFEGGAEAERVSIYPYLSGSSTGIVISMPL